MSFGFSAGDIVKCVELLLKLKNNYRDSSQDYQAAIEDVQGLKNLYDQILNFVANHPSTPRAAELQHHAERLHAAIAVFQSKTEKYRTSLDQASSESAWQKAPRKLQYALSHEVTVLKSAFLGPQRILDSHLLMQSLNAISDILPTLQIAATSTQAAHASVTSLQNLMNDHQREQVEVSRHISEELSQSTAATISASQTNICHEINGLRMILNHILALQETCSAQSLKDRDEERASLRECVSSLRETLNKLVELKIRERDFLSQKPTDPSSEICSCKLTNDHQGMALDSASGRCISGTQNTLRRASLDCQDQRTTTSPSESPGTYPVTIDSLQRRDVIGAVTQLWANSWPQNHPATSTAFAIYRLEWELPLFLATLSDTEAQLSQVLSITGDCGDAFGATVGDYLRKTWEGTGEFFLGAIERSVSDWNRSVSATHGTLHLSVSHLGKLQESLRTSASAVPKVPSEQPVFTSNCTITVEGSLQEQVSMSCMMMWITAVCRRSTLTEVALSGATLTQRHQPPLGPFSFNITLSKLKVLASAKPCWLAMFQRMVVASGFPIPPRTHGSGLEMSFADMKALSACDDLYEYDGGLIAAGLVSVLIPTIELPEDNALQWHFCSRYRTSKDSEPRLERIPQVLAEEVGGNWHKVLSTTQLETRRVFLGWTDHATVVIGTRSAETMDILNSDLPAAKNPNVGFRSTPFGSGRGKVSNFAKGTSRSIDMARQELVKQMGSDEKTILLYDTKDKVAYLIPRADVVMQMVGSLLREKTHILYKNGQKTTIPFPKGHRAANYTAESVALLLSENLEVKGTTTLGIWRVPLSDLIRKYYMDIEVASDISKANYQITRFPKVLRGWEYKDFALQDGISTIKEVRVDKPWVNLVGDEILDVVVLFCRMPRQPIVPRSPDALCPAWRTVPIKRNYLVVTSRIISNLLGSQKRVSGKSRLSKNIHWCLDSPVFPTCDCRAAQTACHHVQGLEEVELENGDDGLRDAVEEFPDGAIIFEKSGTSDLLRGDDTGHSNHTEENVQDVTERRPSGGRQKFTYVKGPIGSPLESTGVTSCSSSSSLGTPELSVGESPNSESVFTGEMEDPQEMFQLDPKRMGKGVEDTDDMQAVQFLRAVPVVV